MSKKIDLEREFFKAVRDIATRKKAKEAFILRISQISEEWIDDKFRLGILGLKNK